jgi:hypothetical protein
MPVWSGKFQYRNAGGGIIDQGPCRFELQRETAIVSAAGGTPIAFDLGDVDRVAPGEWDLELALYSGHSIVLRQFGAAFSGMAGELTAAWRDRTVECLLLEDLEEVARYPGAANGAPAELRIFRSNLAVLPHEGPPVQWRLADIDALRFDDSAYQLVLERGEERLALGKLGKKTDEAVGNLAGAVEALCTEAARTLHDVFPFLGADALQRMQRVMPEGRSASLRDLAEIDARLPDVLIGRAVDERLRPYFDALRERSAGPLFAGFKFLRPDNEASPEEGEPDALFFWFFFPLPGNLAAWEATTGSGRATYLFRTGSDLAHSIRQITRGLALINFRREPVYLPDSSIEQQPKFRRYAIGARRLPELRALRAAYVGRAIHSTPEEWLHKVNELL